MRVFFAVSVLALAFVPFVVDARDRKVIKAFEGDSPPDAELAHLRVSQDSDRRFLFSRRGLSLTFIDGRKYESFWTGSLVVDEVLLKPGRHTVIFEATTLGGRYAKMGMTFEAEPGKSYAAKTEFHMSFVKIWIEETASGVSVGRDIGDVE